MKEIKLPFEVNEHVRLNAVPNYLQKSVNLNDICVVQTISVYCTDKGVCAIYRLFNLCHPNYFSVHQDFLREA